MKRDSVVSVVVQEDGTLLVICGDYTAVFPIFSQELLHLGIDVVSSGKRRAPKGYLVVGRLLDTGIADSSDFVQFWHLTLLSLRTVSLYSQVYYIILEHCCQERF